MRRREFITLAGSAAMCSPLAARAQQAKLPTIGFLGPNTPSLDGNRVAALVQRLRELGWIEGRTINIEYRWSEGRKKLATEIAAEFVRLKVDVIVTWGTVQIIAAKQATSAIPIVFAAAGDPVGNGLVASLARPGGNVTGLSLQQTDAVGKRLELLHEIIPGLRHLAIMANIDAPPAVSDMRETQAAARVLGLEVVTQEIRRFEDIAPAFETLKGRAEAVYVCNEPFLAGNRVLIANLVLSGRLPTMNTVREYVEVGGLISYGPNFPDLYRRSADFVDKILRGAKPAARPVERALVLVSRRPHNVNSRERKSTARTADPSASRQARSQLAGAPRFAPAPAGLRRLRAMTR
jgi:putative tryptophan/tyrosine transport system substrate-binding protein